jgi:hypothetical protein
MHLSQWLVTMVSRMRRARLNDWLQAKTIHQKKVHLQAMGKFCADSIHGCPLSTVVAMSMFAVTLQVVSQDGSAGSGRAQNE